DDGRGKPRRRLVTVSVASTLLRGKRSRVASCKRTTKACAVECLAKIEAERARRSRASKPPRGIGDGRCEDYPPSALSRGGGRPALRRRVEELEDRNWELGEAEERARGLLEAQGDLIVRRDGTQRIAYANDAFCRMSGRMREELLGSAFAVPSIEQGDTTVLLDGTRIYDQKLATAEGDRWIAWREAMVRVSEGTQVQAVGRDVTDRVEA